MTTAHDHLRRALPALTSVAVVGVLAALPALVAGQTTAASIAVWGAIVATLIVVASELAAGALGDAPEYAFARLMLGMTLRGFGAAAAIGAAVLLFECEPRAVALVALPIYFATLCGEVWESLARLREAPATTQGVG